MDESTLLLHALHLGYCGKVVMDGPVQEVTDAFTQDTLTLQAHERWSTDAAPTAEKTQAGAGDDLPEPPHARLVSASIIAADGARPRP